MLWATFSSGLTAVKRLNAFCFLVAASMVISIIFELFWKCAPKRAEGARHFILNKRSYVPHPHPKPQWGRVIFKRVLIVTRDVYGLSQGWVRGRQLGVFTAWQVWQKTLYRTVIYNELGFRSLMLTQLLLKVFDEYINTETKPRITRFDLK